jgi:regulator of sirC expression with transglutaminase-like and TPR domain
MSMKTYTDYKKSQEIVQESLVQNWNDEKFDASKPDTVMVHNQGVGGVHSLQGMRKRVVQILEDCLEKAKMAESKNDLAYFEYKQILSLLDPKSMSGVLIPYLKNHQAAIEELEEKRKKGGKLANRIPKDLLG